MKILTLFGIILTIAAVAFAVQNTSTVAISFFGWQTERAPLALILTSAFGVGVVAGLLVSFPSMVGRMRKISQLRRQVDDRTRELDEAQSQLTQLNMSRLIAPSLEPSNHDIQPPDRSVKWQ